MEETTKYAYMRHSD